MLTSKSKKSKAISIQRFIVQSIKGSIEIMQDPINKMVMTFLKKLIIKSTQISFKRHILSFNGQRFMILMYFQCQALIRSTLFISLSLSLSLSLSISLSLSLKLQMMQMHR